MTTAVNTTLSPNTRAFLNSSLANGSAALEIQNILQAVPATGTGIGVPVLRIPLRDFRNADGSVIVAASQAAGNFLAASTIGTSLNLAGNAADANTKTDIAVCEFDMPSWYVASQTFEIIVNAQYVTTGTVGTKTVLATLHALTDAGLEGADLVGVAAKALTTAAADYTFAVPTTAALTPGQRVRLVVTTVIQDTASGSEHSQVNSVRLV